MPAVMALFKEPRGLLMHGGALLYAVTGYVAGFAGLFVASWLVNAAATLLLAHAMVIAAYLIHECGHNLVFKRQRDNTRLGRFMSWICGAAYGTYEDMRYKHFRHHVDNGDLVWFDYEYWFANSLDNSLGDQIETGSLEHRSPSMAIWPSSVQRAARTIVTRAAHLSLRTMAAVGAKRRSLLPMTARRVTASGLRSL